MQQASPTDNSLIRKIRNGDELAATELYDRYSGRVTGLVSTQIGDYLKANVEAEDVVQSVFKSVFRGITSSDYQAPESGSLWHLIAVLAIHKVRGKARQQTASKRDARRTESLDDALIAELKHSSPQEWEVATRECLEKLTKSEQEVIAFRIQGFAVEEIAERIGKSRRTVERLLQTAREELSRMFIDD